MKRETEELLRVVAQEMDDDPAIVAALEHVLRDKLGELLEAGERAAECAACKNCKPRWDAAKAKLRSGSGAQPSREALRKLIAKWRQNGKGVSNSNFVKGMDHQSGICADELEAALAAEPVQEVHPCPPMAANRSIPLIKAELVRECSAWRQRAEEAEDALSRRIFSVAKPAFDAWWTVWSKENDLQGEAARLVAQAAYATGAASGARPQGLDDIEHNYFYHNPLGNEKAGFYYCLCGWEGPDIASYCKHLPLTAPHVKELSEEQVRWRSVKESMPTKIGDYLVLREHAELHDIRLAVTAFHPNRQHPWYDKGFNYLFWIGPLEMPTEENMNALLRSGGKP